VSYAADLASLAPALAPPGHRGPSRGAAGPQLCPRLMTTYSPRVSWRRATAPDTTPWHDGMLLEGDLWAAQPPGSPGFISPAKSEKRGRYGLFGLRSQGRREIWRSLKLLEDLRPQLFFWTVTLPDQALAEIERGSGWAVFQDRVRKELHRLLTDRLGHVLMIGVAEVQEKRLKNHGTYAPHLHVAFVGKRRGWNRWAFDHGDLDRIIVAAAMTAGASRFDSKAAGNVAPVRASVCAYMAKYMTKGADPTLCGLRRENLIPHQWWFRSAELLRWVSDHVFPIALEFLAWVHERRRALVDAGLIQHQQVEGLPESAPICWRVDWRGPPELAEVIALWQESVWDAEWLANHQLLHGRAHPCQHPQRD
jgi:hypothetical protein